MGFLISLVDFMLGGLVEATGKKVFIMIRLCFLSILSWFIILVCAVAGSTALELWGAGFIGWMFAIIAWILALVFFTLWICLCYLCLKKY